MMEKTTRELYRDAAKQAHVDAERLVKAMGTVFKHVHTTNLAWKEFCEAWNALVFTHKKRGKRGQRRKRRKRHRK